MIVDIILDGMYMVLENEKEEEAHDNSTDI